MKINQWTLGLAAVGVISLASAVNAEEGQMNTLQTALSSTTISGYVDTSLEWTLGNKDSTIQSYIPFRSENTGGANKADGFNLNVVKLTIEKPLDESEWAAGYKVDLLFGPDAVYYNSSGFSGNNSGDLAIKQAYVALRTPVGNGIDWKMGVFDTIIGYETFEAGNNPNFTRSWGYAVEPTEHTGILGTYRINDNVAVAAGIANTLNAGIDNQSNLGPDQKWRKTYMASVAVTAPDNYGFLSGSTFYGGVVGGLLDTGGYNNQTEQVNWYAGATLNTPVTGLKAGLALDYVKDPQSLPGGIIGNANNVWIVGAYASYQATEKLSLHGRAEFGQANTSPDETTIGSLTGTVQYDLWQNVISRLELRWDQAYNKNGRVSYNETFHTANTGVSLYANIIYKF